MTLGLIWAQSRSGVIGNAGGIPWHVPEDSAHFRAVTGTGTVIMGRRTWDSLPDRFRPLPGRRNVVVTAQIDWNADGALVAHSVSDALTIAEPDADNMVWIIGGGVLYAQTMDIADRLEVTEIEIDSRGDTYAPPISVAWELRDTQPGTGWSTSRTGIRYRFRSYERVTPARREPR